MTVALTDTPICTRYKESRTLVRRLCRLPGESRDDYKRKVLLLREHFERFNTDTAGICQWIMGLRKRAGDEAHPESFGTLGDFLLEPALSGVEADEKERDGWRLSIFDDVAGFRRADSIAGRSIPDDLRRAMDDAAERGPHRDPGNRAAARLFDRLRTLDRAHRLVLLKSAAEWVVARYKCGVENWIRQRAAWEQERDEWERAHPDLTPEVRERFTGVFRNLLDPERDERQGIRAKAPRICPWDRLRQNVDNCCYGQKGHGPLCWKYAEFVRARKQANTAFNDKRFWEDAEKFVRFCHEQRKSQPTKQFSNPNLPRVLFNDLPERERGHAVTRLKKNWIAYLNAMGMNDTTAVQHGRLPHCRKIGGQVFEKSECLWNPHTKLCDRYRRAVAQLPDALLALESEYREWRRFYLAGPRKPTFAYPSARDLPMPKVFGEGFHEIDLDRSVVRLRLEGAPGGEWVEFAFIPWPRGYKPSKREVNITSVHVHFVGARPRAGFRFDAPHKPSRFACSQDELQHLRSREFPRRAHDRQFIDAARRRLLDTFAGDSERDMRILAVDLGEKGAHAAVYRGRTHERDIALRIVKINALYDAPPSTLVRNPRDPKGRQRPASIEFKEKEDPRGLRKEHLARHLARLAERSVEIAQRRRREGEPDPQPAPHDQRGLQRHVAWMIRDWARLNAARVIAAAEEHRCDLIVFESMRGQRPPAYNQLGDEAERKKRSAAMHAYGRVRAKVTEKAVERGMRVVTAPFHNSSRVCSACGARQENIGLFNKNKTKRTFICEKCKREVNSDANAARVLARVFWGEITLPAPEPGGP